MADGMIDPNAKPTEDISVREVFGIDSDMAVQGLRRADGPGARVRPDLQVRPRHDAGDPRGLLAQPPRDDPGLPRHRQVDAYRAGGRPAELALRAGEPRQPHQPDRPDRQGRDQAAGRHAGDRVPGGHPALGAAQPHRHRLRRIRRGPPRRDVRDPARAGTSTASSRFSTRTRSSPRTSTSASSPPRTPWVWATRRASTPACSRSTRRRWTAGALSRR